MKKTIASFLLAAAATGMIGGIGDVSAAPASVQRAGGPCYQHELGKDSSDGKLFCSGLNGVWESKEKWNAPTITRSQIGTACPKLGAQARLHATDSFATCKQTPRGLRWWHP